MRTRANISMGATVAFNTEYFAHEQDAEGVTATLCDWLKRDPAGVAFEYEVLQ
ncbi:FAD-dependent monooxygenase [Bradyrhizobium sp. sBnM-33]|uniref:FAD-dependent monooxygenase n=1 Tax=Bradyrhizobium sp. sBnM-33 TaxID=2831780 RepID=UPI0020BF9926|nr:FAD-dependent monooxygenase [Bradyrhizobium sp. sBnM-33]WOH54842.1 FAD-dependent monooxygenase [Bradyrhizobium sp. sBnM-33]